ncbi:MAG: hypothetical protein ACRBN8_26730 [Nannocystales bacterium]
MGEPLRIDSASTAPWASLEAKRVLLLCAEDDRLGLELTRPQLELQNLQVEVVSDAFDPRAVWAALEADPCPTVVAVVVSQARARRAARPLIDAFSEVAGPRHRLLVLDLRRRTSVLQQVRALSGAIEGLELTLQIARGSRAALTTSATANPRAAGERRLSPCGMGTRPLRVVQPSVLLSADVHSGAQTIPARTRFRVTRPERPMAETCPELPLID